MVEIDIELYKWYCYQIVAIIFTLLLVYCANHSYLPLTNYWIPDSVHYEIAAFNYQKDDIRTYFFNLNRLLYSVGPQTFTIYNALLLLGSIYFCKIFSCISDKAVAWARATIVLNPYFLISVTGPTKEINLTFLSLFCFFLFFKNSNLLKSISFVVALYACAVRPQFGLILILGLISSVSLRIFTNPVKHCLYILAAYFILNPIPIVNNYITELSGGEDLPYFQISIYHSLALVLLEMNKSPILQFAVFAIKLVLGLFAPIARPSTLGSEYIPLLDWGYSFMAMLLFPLNLAFVLLFLNWKKKIFAEMSQQAKMIIVYTFLGVLSTLVSPIIQFRYLFPYLPMLGAIYLLQPVKIRNWIVGISAIMILISFVGSLIWLSRDYEKVSTYLPIFVSWL
jgi:hypothetical protein